MTKSKQKATGKQVLLSLLQVTLYSLTDATMWVSMLVAISLYIQAAQEAPFAFLCQVILGIAASMAADLSCKTIVHYVKIFYTV